LRRSTRVEAVRGLLSAVAVVAVLGGPALAITIEEPFLRAAARAGHFIDPGPLPYFGPSVAAVFLLVCARVLFPIRGDARAAAAYRFSFLALTFGFVFLNASGRRGARDHLPPQTPPGRVISRPFRYGFRLQPRVRTNATHLPATFPVSAVSRKSGQRM